MAAVALLLIAFALRVHLLAEADIWWDEGLAVWAVRQGLAAAVRWTAGDVHPPLFFASLWAWLHLVGDSAFALRLGVALVGVVVAALAWPLGRRLGGPWGGALAVAVVGTSRFMVWWSMELRMYTLAAAAVMVATLGAVRWLDTRRRRDLALYALGAAAALWTVYLAGAALVAMNVWVGWVAVGRGDPGRRKAALRQGPKALTPRPPPSPHRAKGAAGTPWNRLGEGEVASPREFGWRDVGAWSAAQVAVLVAFAPWAIYAGGRMSSWRVVTEGPSAAFVARLWLTLLATGVSTDIDAATPWVIAFAAALLLAMVFAIASAHRIGDPLPRRRDLPLPQTWGRGSGGEGLRRPASLLFALLVIPPACVWAVTQPRSLFYSPNVEARYFVPFAAPALAVAAALIARVAHVTPIAARRSAAVVLAALLLAPSLYHLPAYYAPRRATDTLPTMTLAIWSEAEPGDVVVLVSGNRYPLWLYHYDREWVQPLRTPRYEFPAEAPPRWADRPPVVLFPDRGSDPLAAHADWQSKLDGIVDNHKRVWLVEYGRDLQDPKGEVEAWLAGRMTRVLSEGYGADALHLFAKDGREPVVTGLSARWPGTRWEDFQESAVRVVHPLVGISAHRALAGDVLNSVMFPRAGALAGGEKSSPICSQFVSLGHWPPQWLSILHEEDPRTPPAGRWRTSIEVTDRTTGGKETLSSAMKCPGLPLYFGQRVTILAPPPRLDRLPPPPGLVWLPSSWLALGHHYPSPGVVIFKGRGGDAYLDGVGLQSVPRQWLRGWLTSNSLVKVPADGQLIVDLSWRRTPIEGSPPAVFVHLIGAPRPDGNTVWGGDDSPFNPEISVDRHVLTVDPTAPPGHYQIEIGVYDSVTGERYRCHSDDIRCDPDRVLFDVDVGPPSGTRGNAHG